MLFLRSQHTAGGCGGRREKGFTLVEVIVVIVIIAILASIGVPALTGYIDKANQRKLVAMAREATTALQSVISENYIKKTVDGDGMIAFPDDVGYDILYGYDKDNDGVYIASPAHLSGDFVGAGDYDFVDDEDWSTYYGIEGFYGEMWKLTKIPMKVNGSNRDTFNYIAFTSQGQILAYLMFDPSRDLQDGDGLMIGYNISPDTTYNTGTDAGSNTPPSYDPDAGFSYWKVKNDGKSIEPW